MNNRERWTQTRSRWTLALQGIARKHGTGSPVYKILGTVAWGRFSGEAQPGEHIDHIAFGAGFLEGVRYAALNAAESLHLSGEDDLRRIHDRIREDMP